MFTYPWPAVISISRNAAFFQFPVFYYLFEFMVFYLFFSLPRYEFRILNKTGCDVHVHVHVQLSHN